MPVAVVESEIVAGDELAPPAVDRREQRFPTAYVLAAVLVSVLLRARFVTTPLTSDEGGYLAVARAWAAGKGLYTQAWVDRPQGLIVLFRTLNAVTGGSAESVRMMAIVFGCLAVAGVAYAVFAIAGETAAIAASLVVAVASANARIEGFIANGELLAGGVAALGLAAACAHLFRGHTRRWLFVAGVLGGCAISLKQSGFDASAAIVVCILAGGFTHERSWPVVRRELGMFAAGIASVIAILVVHAALIGFRSWWYAVAGYRLNGVNGTSGADWDRFHLTAQIAAPTIRPLAAAALLGLVLWLARDRRLSAASVLIPAWMCFAAFGFVMGGLFHRHYWVSLTFPLAAAAGVGLAKLNSRILFALATAAVLIPSFISTMHVVALDRVAVANEAHSDPRLVIDEKIGDWYRANGTADSTIYVMCASAALYASADAASPYPYLWRDGVLHAQHAQERLVDLFTGDHPPTFVAIYQGANSCNPSGAVAKALRDRYETRTIIDGVRVAALRDPQPES